MIEQIKNKNPKHLKKNWSLGLGLLSLSFVIPMTLGVVGCASTKPDSKNDSSHAGEQLINKNFLAYYRAWRDVKMEGVNTDLPDKNWITMDDIPYGINIVNVFSYVPPGQEAKAQPYFDELKSKYGPNLHQRGIKLIRGFGYDDLFMFNQKDWNNPAYQHLKGNRQGPDYEGEYPTSEQVKSFVDKLLDRLMNIEGFQLDGIDIDMEQNPDNHQVDISNDVIKNISTRIGPKSGNEKSIFLYDTNNSNLNPFTDVADCFDNLAYQQYGSDSSRTIKVVKDYEEVIEKNKIIPGLTFPEENDQNRWFDTKFPYEESNFYDVAKYVQDSNLGGMFVYALDRDGRNYQGDISTIRPSNLLWTKTAILESNGVSFPTARDLALHHLDRIQYSLHLSKEKMMKLQTEINESKNLLDINAVVMGYDYEEGLSPTYDPILENTLVMIDLKPVHKLINQARELIINKVPNFKEISVLKKKLEDLIGSKQFNQDELNESMKNLNNSCLP